MRGKGPIEENDTVDSTGHEEVPQDPYSGLHVIHVVLPSKNLWKKLDTQSLNPHTLRHPSTRRSLPKWQVECFKKRESLPQKHSTVDQSHDLTLHTRRSTYETRTYDWTLTSSLPRPLLSTWNYLKKEDTRQDSSRRKTKTNTKRKGSKRRNIYKSLLKNSPKVLYFRR